GLGAGAVVRAGENQLQAGGGRAAEVIVADRDVAHGIDGDTLGEVGAGDGVAVDQDGADVRPRINVEAAGREQGVGVDEVVGEGQPGLVAVEEGLDGVGIEGAGGTAAGRLDLIVVQGQARSPGEDAGTLTGTARPLLTVEDEGEAVDVDVRIKDV